MQAHVSSECASLCFALTLRRTSETHGPRVLTSHTQVSALPRGAVRSLNGRLHSRAITHVHASNMLALSHHMGAFGARTSAHDAVPTTPPPRSGLSQATSHPAGSAWKEQSLEFRPGRIFTRLRSVATPSIG